VAEGAEGPAQAATTPGISNTLSSVSSANDMLLIRVPPAVEQHTLSLATLSCGVCYEGDCVSVTTSQGKRRARPLACRAGAAQSAGLAPPW
jgi:hypothetical protein